jgi:hypothetical protein
LDGPDLRSLNLGAKRNTLIEGIAAARLKTLAVFARFGTAAKPLRDGIAGGVEGWYPGIRGVEELCATPIYIRFSGEDDWRLHGAPFPAIRGFQMGTTKNSSRRKTE